MSVKMRQQVERRIVRRLVNDMLTKGYRLSVSLERGYDIDEMLVGSRDKKKIVAEAMAGDEAHIFVHKGDYEVIQEGRVVSDGWVYLVFGNDGWDVMSDYTTNLESDLEGVTKLADKYSE